MAVGIRKNYAPFRIFMSNIVLSAAEGVSEVASVGGFIKEYQVDVNPNALKAFWRVSNGRDECRAEKQS